MPTLTSNISAISKSIFKNFGAYHVANFLNFLKLTQLLYFGRVEADKIAKSKVGPILWDTLYVKHFSQKTRFAQNQFNEYILRKKCKFCANLNGKIPQ